MTNKRNNNNNEATAFLPPRKQKSLVKSYGTPLEVEEGGGGGLCYWNHQQEHQNK
jgi:hypothetical protein